MYHSDLTGGLLGRITGVQKLFGELEVQILNKNTNISLKLLFKICSLSSKFIPDTIIFNSQRGRDFHIENGYRGTILKLYQTGLTAIYLSI